jgi:hypothetical protein
MENVRKRLASPLLALPRPMMTFSRSRSKGPFSRELRDPPVNQLRRKFHMKTFGSTNEIRTDILLVDSRSGTVHKTWTVERNGGEKAESPTSKESPPRLSRAGE